MQIISSGLRGTAGPAIYDNDPNRIERYAKSGADLIKKTVEDEYQKRSDFYDIQKEETDQLSAMLEGLDGRDYQEMMAEVIKARDEYAQIFRGKTLKDYNTPEFQASLFNKKKELATMANTMATSKKNYADALAAIEKTDHFRKDDAKRWVISQLSKSVKEREKDPASFLLTDPQFRNTQSWLKQYFKDQGANEALEIEETSNYIKRIPKFNYKALYNETGDLVISDKEVKDLLDSNLWLKNVVREYYRSPEMNKAMKDGGFSVQDEEGLIRGFKDYVKTIQGLKNWTDGITTANKSRPPSVTTHDKNQAQYKSNVDNLQEALLSDNLDTNVFKVLEDVSRSKEGDLYDIKATKTASGKVRITFTINESKGTRVKAVAREYGVIDPNDWAAVNSLYQYLTKNSNKGKKVEAESTNPSTPTKGGAARFNK